MREEDFYTFVAYKPESACYSMGCLMESYSADFIFEAEIGEDEVIGLWAQILSEPLDGGERGYDEPKILRNGVLLGDWDDAYSRMYEEARMRADDIIEDRKERARKAKEAKAQKAAKEREERDREEFARLQKKFADPTKAP